MMNCVEAEQIKAVAVEGLAALADPAETRPAWTRELVAEVEAEAGALAETGAALLLASARDCGSTEKLPARAAQIVADAVAAAQVRRVG